MLLTDAKWILMSRSPVCSSLAGVILEDVTAGALSWACCGSCCSLGEEMLPLEGHDSSLNFGIFVGAGAEYGFCCWENWEKLGFGDGQGLKMGVASSWYGLCCMESRMGSWNW